MKFVIQRKHLKGRQKKLAYQINSNFLKIYYTVFYKLDIRLLCLIIVVLIERPKENGPNFEKSF